IARHRADGREPVRHQRGSGAHAGSCGRGLAAGMAPADHDDIVSHDRVAFLNGGSVARNPVGSKGVSRETCPPWRLASFRQMGRPSAAGFVPPKWMRPARSLADTKIPEDDIQNIFDVDASGQSPKSPARQAKLLGDDILAALGLL